MAREIGFRAQVALLFYSTVNVVLFTAAIYAVTLFPPLTPNAGFWITVFTAASLIVTAPVAWYVGGCVPAALCTKILARPRRWQLDLRATCDATRSLSKARPRR